MYLLCAGILLSTKIRCSFWSPSYRIQYNNRKIRHGHTQYIMQGNMDCETGTQNLTGAGIGGGRWVQFPAHRLSIWMYGFRIVGVIFVLEGRIGGSRVRVVLKDKSLGAQGECAREQRLLKDAPFPISLGNKLLIFKVSFEGWLGTKQL